MNELISVDFLFFRLGHLRYLSQSRILLWLQTVEKGAERRKVIAKRDKKQTLPIK